MEKWLYVMFIEATYKLRQLHVADKDNNYLL